MLKNNYKFILRQLPVVQSSILSETLNLMFYFIFIYYFKIWLSMEASQLILYSFSFLESFLAPLHFYSLTANKATWYGYPRSRYIMIFKKIFFNTIWFN